jgi:hypothetical protein
LATLQPVRVEVVGTPTVRVVWNTTPPPAAVAALDSAITRWQLALQSRDGLAPDAPGAGNCGGTSRVVYGTEDLTVIVMPLPGNPGYVADAFPCEVRADGTTRVGVIRIALSHMNEALPMTPRDLFSHELGHVLGIAGGWFSRAGLTTPSGRLPTASDADPRFIGVRSRAAALSAGVLASNAGVPIETTDGAFGHWRGAPLAGELMAWANVPNMKLSAVTISTLADLGYRVHLEAAEPFAAPTAALQDGAPTSKLDAPPSRMMIR